MGFTRAEVDIAVSGSAQATMALWCETTHMVTGAIISLPLIAESAFTPETTNTELTDESRDIHVIGSDTKVTFTAQLMARNLDNILAPFSDYGGNTYVILKEHTAVNKGINGYYEYIAFKGKVTPKANVSNPAENSEFEVIASKHTAAATIPLACMDDSAFAKALTGNAVFANGDYFKIIRIAV